jgi:hypothetical protein
MTDKPLKRPRDPAQLAKLMIDIASGEVEDRAPEPSTDGKDAAAVLLQCMSLLLARNGHAEVAR